MTNLVQDANHKVHWPTKNIGIKKGGAQVKTEDRKLVSEVIHIQKTKR